MTGTRETVEPCLASWRRVCRPLLLAMLLLAVTLVGASCGDSGGSAAVTVKTGDMSHAEFVREADRICRERRAEFDRKFRQLLASVGSNTNTEAQSSELVNDIIVPVYSRLIEDIGELGAPSRDAEEVEAFLVAVRASLNEGEKDPHEFIEGGASFGRAVREAQAYGIIECADTLG